jgi:hypothetical protein
MKVTFHSAFDNSAFNMFARQRTYKLNDWLIAECPPAALVSRGSSTSSLPACESVLMKEEGMNDRTEADKAWEARQEAARYRIFNATTNAAEATDEADDEKYFAVLD